MATGPVWQRIRRRVQSGECRFGAPTVVQAALASSKNRCSGGFGGYTWADESKIVGCPFKGYVVRARQACAVNDWGLHDCTQRSSQFSDRAILNGQDPSSFDER